MSTKALTRQTTIPTIFEDFFRPWNTWFDNTDFPGRIITMPSVNIAENHDRYNVSIAVPGMKKSDFTIDVDGNMLNGSM
jgi:HSP20 family protein